MPRARNIKPAFFANDDLAELPPLTRLYFIGLWTLVDFKGCMEYRPKKIKAQILPYDDCDISEMSSELMRSDLIRIYINNGKKYLKVVNFSKHQTPHKQEIMKGSEIPDIMEAIDSKEENKNGVITDQNTNEIGCHRADSLFLIPDSGLLIPDPIKSDKVGNGQSTIDPELLDFCFDQFWESGIRKVNKKKAKPLFGKILRKHSNPDSPTMMDFTNTLVTDIKKRLESGQLGFAEMHPTTYLNNERWTDEIRPGGINGQNRNHRESLAERSTRQTAEALARIEAEEANSSALGANDESIRPQVGEPGRPSHDGKRGILDGVFTVVPETGTPDQ